MHQEIHETGEKGNHGKEQTDYCCFTEKWAVVPQVWLATLEETLEEDTSLCCKITPPSQSSLSFHSCSAQRAECKTPLCRLARIQQTAAALVRGESGGIIENNVKLRCVWLTVLRELHHVVEHGAVAIEGAHPGEHHAAAVGGIQGGHEVLRGVRQLTVEGKGEKKEAAQKN